MSMQSAEFESDMLEVAKILKKWEVWGHTEKALKEVYILVGMAGGEES
jgi:hypothetical protein